MNWVEEDKKFAASEEATIKKKTPHGTNLNLSYENELLRGRVEAVKDIKSAFSGLQTQTNSQDLG